MNKWVISGDYEGGWLMDEFESRAEAIKLAPSRLSLIPGEPFWVGKRNVSAYIQPDAAVLLSDMTEMAVYVAGEEAASWLDLVSEEAVTELQEKLNEVLASWQEKHNIDTPGAFAVEIEEYLAP